MIHKLKKLRTEVKHYTCKFHTENPNKTYAGCICSSSYTGTEKPCDEIVDERNFQMPKLSKTF